MAGQGAYIPSVAIAGAPPDFIAPPAAIPTAGAVGPQDVIAAAGYKKAVKQLRGITGGAIVTMQEEADVTCNHLKAVAAHGGLGQAALLGLPAQLAAFQAHMADVPGQLAAQQQQLAVLQQQLAAQQAAMAQMAEVPGQLAAQLAAQQQQHRNSLLRMANSQAGGAGDFSVLVISKEQAGGLQPLGARPAVQPAGPYPATATELRELTHNRLDLLAAFYNEHFGVGPAAAQPGQPTTPILQRRRMFALFIGFPRP